MSDSHNFITSIIKGRKVTYYLTTEDDLNNVKSNSILGDIFFGLASLSLGGCISVLISKSTGVGLEIATIKTLDLLLYVFISLTIVFAVFAAYFFTRSFRTINKIKGSGEVKSLNSIEPNELNSNHENDNSRKNELEIIKASFWTSKEKKNVTDIIREQVKDNQLNMLVHISLLGDPDEYTAKKLTLNYKYNNLHFTKEYNEEDKIAIP